MRRREFISASLGLGTGLILACAPATAPAPSAGGTPAPGTFLSPGVGAPKRGGMLTMGAVANEPPHFDPTAGGGGNASAFAYEELLFNRADTFDDATKVGGLAEKWSVSPDGLTYTFNIRKGVKWQNLPPVNGRAFDASDVAWNLKLWSDSASRKTVMAVIDKWVVKDPYTIDVVLKYPFAPFINTVIGGMVMLAREVHEKAGSFRETAIGTGPWIFDKWERGNFIRWKANPDYWQQGADGKPLPYVDGITWYAFKDDAGAVAAIRANQLDMYVFPDPTSMDLKNVTALKRDRKDLLFQDSQRANIIGVNFNMKRAPWSDVKVRQAVALGLDKDDLITVALEGDSSRTGLIPLTLREWAWSEQRVKEKYAVDRPAAQKALKDLGVLSLPVEIMPNNANSNGVLGVQALGAQLQELGFTKVNVTIPPTLATGTQIIQNGKFDLTFFTFGTSYEVDDWLWRYWATTGTGNQWGYSNARFDQLVDQERREQDPAKRKALVDQLQDMLYADMVSVPVAMKPTEHKVVHPRVKNLKVIHNQRMNLASVWIDG